MLCVARFGARSADNCECKLAQADNKRKPLVHKQSHDAMGRYSGCSTAQKSPNGGRVKTVF